MLLISSSGCRTPRPEPSGTEAPKVTQEFETGKVIGRVVTRHDPKQSYALYLPKAYTPDRTWPILYGFSPDGRGQIPVDLFRDAAERYGWIVAGSNNSRNGPSEPIWEALAALRKDTFARLSIDRSRMYATGFSGGARVAFYFALDPESRCAGIIPCGAGFGNRQPAKQDNITVCAISGLRCFNYPELLRVESALTKLGVRQRLVTFNGGHQWPRADVCRAALRYMELVRLCQDGKMSDPSARQILKLEVSDAEHLLGREGEFMRGHARFKELAALFAGDSNDVDLSQRVAAMESTERYVSERAALDRWVRLDFEPRSVLGDEHKMDAVIADAQAVAKECEGTDAAERAKVMLRMLPTLLFHAGMQYHQKGEYPRAVSLLTRARILAPNDPLPAYNLACAQARAGQTDDALKTLAEAVRLGFKESKTVEQDPDLESLRARPEYSAILQALESSAPAGK